MVLFDFSSEPECRQWQPINDLVMGGRSRSGFKWAGESIAVFTGSVSLENSGGFASVRSIPSVYDLREYTGVRLRVRGDGKRYKLNLKTEAGFDGVQYQSAFDPGSGEWREVTIPFSEFIPVFRGRRLEHAAQLDTAHISSFGILISGKQEGPFRLEVDWIAGYR